MKVAFTLLTLATVAISSSYAAISGDQTVSAIDSTDIPQLNQNGTIIGSWGP